MNMKHLATALASHSELLVKAIADGDEAETGRHIFTCRQLAGIMKALGDWPAPGQMDSGRISYLRSRLEQRYPKGSRQREAAERILERGLRPDIRCGNCRRTPRWDYLIPLLGYLDSHEGLVSTSEVKNHLEGTMELTEDDFSNVRKRSGAITWRYEVDWVKRVLLVAGMVEDNGARGNGARWAITQQGSALLKLLRAGDVDPQEWWRENLRRTRRTD